MTQKFIFRGQTTFIDKPLDTVIQNFQNTYFAGDGSDRDKINAEILKLVELVLQSKDLPNDTKEEAAQALHSVADQVKEEKGNKLTLKGTLQAVQDVVSKAADIAVPALGIIAAIFKLLGLG
jgi:hypothetical protein